MRSLIGILGPIASARFLSSIYQASLGAAEQRTARCLVLSDPDVPNWSDALAAGDTRGALREALERGIDMLARSGCDEIIICCVTSHLLLAELPNALRERVVSLVDIALSMVMHDGVPALVLGSRASIEAAVFQSSSLFDATRPLLRFPSATEQVAVQELISSLKTRSAREADLAFCRELAVKHDAPTIVAGCTELHLLNTHGGNASSGPRLLDPLALVATTLAAPDASRLATIVKPPPWRVRSACSADIGSISSLNHVWQGSAIGRDSARGFLSAAFDEPAVAKIVEEGDVVVAESRGRIVGYYLVNRVAESPLQQRQLAWIRDLKSRGILGLDARVAPGAQALVTPLFRGTAMRREMLTALCKAVEDRYDFLFSRINRLNGRATTAHLRDGWRVVDEDEDVHLVALDVRATLATTTR